MKPRQLKALLLLVLIAGMLHAEDQPQEAISPKTPAALVKQQTVPMPVKEASAQPAPALDDLLSRHQGLVEQLVVALRDSEGEVRETTMYTLGRIGKRAIPALIEKLRDKDRDLRANAAYVLAQLGKDSQEALPSLLIALKDGDREVRRRAAYAIHRIIIDTAPAVKEEGEMPVTYRLSWQAADPGLLLPTEVPANLPPIRSSNKPVNRP
ncbi:MAG: HEAT repeat domain-containing protein [Gemmataceae bacterium]